MNIPQHGDNFKRILMNLAILRVRAQDVPNMTVHISPGGFWYYTSTGASYIEYAGGDSPTIAAPASNSKFVLVTINTSGGIVIIDGSASETPVLPDVPRGRFPLSAIHVRSVDTAITSDMIYDVRPNFELTVRDHRDLMSLTLSSSHPASAISFSPGASGLVSTNLQDAIIELKILFDDLYSHIENP